MKAAVSNAKRPPRPPALKRNLALAFTALLVASAALTVDVDASEILEIPGGLARVFDAMFLGDGPEWSYLGRAVETMIESIWIAWIGTVIGAILSLPVGFFGAKNVSSGLISNIVRQVLNGIRAFPELVLAIAIFIPIAGLGPVAGALAIGIHSIGTLGKLTAEVIEGIDAGPVEAARAVGGRSLQVQRWGVLPQVLPEIIAFWLYRFEINIRAAAVLGVVGAGGIGFVLSQAIAFSRYDRAATAMIVVVVATIAIDIASGWVRRRIIEGADRKAAAAEVFEQPEIMEGTELGDRGRATAPIDTDLG